MLEVMAIENSESWNFWAVKVGVLRVSFISFSVEFEVVCRKKIAYKTQDETTSQFAFETQRIATPSQSPMKAA